MSTDRRDIVESDRPRYRVIVTGDRKWECYDVARIILKRLMDKHPDHDVVVIHGGAPGVDTVFAVEANRLGLRNHAFYANWDKLAKRAGPVRNEIMIRSGADLVIALHPHILDSRGTRDCVCRALKAGLPVALVDKLPVSPRMLNRSHLEAFDAHEILEVTDDLIALAEDWSKTDSPQNNEQIVRSEEETPPERTPTQSEGLTQEEEDRIQIEGAGREVELLVDSVDPLTFWKWMNREIQTANESFAREYEGIPLGADIKSAVKSVVYLTHKAGKHKHDPEKKRSLSQWGIIVNAIAREGDNREWMEEYVRSHIKIAREKALSAVRKQFSESD